MGFKPWLECDGDISLLESGTHVLWGARMGAYGVGEVTLAQDVVRSLGKGMLCLADRGFAGYALWQAAAQTGADLLWRTRQNAQLDVDKRTNAFPTALTSAGFTLRLPTDGINATRS